MKYRVFSASILTFVLIGCSQKTPVDQQQVSSISISPDTHNVTVNVTIRKRASRSAIPNVVIDHAGLSCSEIPNGESVLTPSSPDSWCNSQALNVPVTTDVNGKATLYFHVNPSPEEAGIKQTFGPEYNVPMLYWSAEGLDGVSGVEAITANEWRTEPTGYEKKQVSLDSEPFSASIEGLNVEIFKMDFQPIAAIETNKLILPPTGCGPKRQDGYYKALSEKFYNEHETIYLIRDKSLPEATQKVMLLPNKMHYKSTAEFKDDFFRCGVGGNFPILASDKWLMFTENCGGIDQQDNVNEVCLAFEKILVPSLTLKE